MSEIERTGRAPLRRVVVNDAAVPFLARGGRLFSRQIIQSDSGLEDGEIVQVTDRKNNVLGTTQIYKSP